MNAIVWFRLGLRMHDNPALINAIQHALKHKSHVFPIFIVDRSRFELPKSEEDNVRMSANRHKFLHECLEDLQYNLRERGSDLILLYGEPVQVLEEVIEKWNVGYISFERDIAPYSMERDTRILSLCNEKNVKVFISDSCTLFPVQKLIELNNGRTPTTMSSIQSLCHKMGAVESPKPTPSEIPPVDSAILSSSKYYKTIEDGKTIESNFFVDSKKLKFKGGETEALKRLKEHMENTEYICKFEKPKTSPNSLSPSTTVLSPYIAMGCLSPKTFWHEIDAVYKRGKSHTSPPTSLHGQLLFRELFKTAAFATPNFHKMEGNAICKQIQWDNRPELLKAWEEGKTGFPFIDALMIQLKREGWIHHLGRHAVACFLTRGDLYQSWEEGAKVFERYLLDGDYAMNNANWMWLSASAFFYQYFRVYGPVSFGKKTDPEGKFIKKYIPQLKGFPPKYIYQPWEAPLSVQRQVGCIIGTDYPRPIVDHSEISKINIGRMKESYDLDRKRSEHSKVANPSKKQKQ